MSAIADEHWHHIEEAHPDCKAALDLEVGRRSQPHDCTCWILNDRDSTDAWEVRGDPERLFENSKKLPWH